LERQRLPLGDHGALGTLYGEPFVAREVRVKVAVEIWRRADEPDVIHLTHDRFDARVTNREGWPGYDPALYATLAELLDESGEIPAGRRQRGEGKRARHPGELRGDTP
jgi:hypothetical protein